jgi:hypothetical protein
MLLTAFEGQYIEYMNMQGMSNLTKIRGTCSILDSGSLFIFSTCNSCVIKAAACNVQSHDLLTAAGLCVTTSPVLLYCLLVYCLITGIKIIIMDLSKLLILESVPLITGNIFYFIFPYKIVPCVNSGFGRIVRSELFCDVRQRTLVVTDVSEQPLGRVFRGQVFFSGCLTVEDGTDSLSRNAAWHPKRTNISSVESLKEKL